MSTRHPWRSGLLCALACVLALAAIAAPSSAAAAGDGAAASAALAQERYYQSYGDPGPLDSRNPVANPNSWVVAGLCVSGVLVLAITGVAGLRRTRRPVPS
jgi:hypothetical protein